MENREKRSVFNESLLVYLLAAIIGLAAFLRAFPVDFLAGKTAFYWGDLASNVSGFYAFRDTNWHFPIYWTNRLNYPEGLSIINTDSIPLAALVFKILSPLLPPDFHFYGIWYGLAYVSQAIGAVFLIRQLGGKRLWQGLLAACFALLVPAFIMRASHTALMTHSIILFALGLYFRAVRLYEDKQPPLSWFFSFLLLIGATFLVHPYLTVMILLIYWAALLDKPQIRSSWRTILTAWGASIIVLLLVYMIFWYTPDNPTVKDETGFGIYSMNLLAPVVGGRIIHWGTKFQPRPEQSFEGLNYFGLGVLGLFILALLLKRTSLKKTLSKYKFLVLMLLGLAIYAASNIVYAGQRLVFTYPEWLSYLIKPLSNNFRASGRLFWPVGYTILFASLIVVLTSKKNWTVLLALGLLAVQFYDVPVSNYPAMAQNESFARRNYPEPIWDQLIKGKSIIYLEPGWECGGGYDQILPLQYLAARNRVLLDTAYASRQSPNCKLKFSAARKNITQENTIHVYFSSNAREQIVKWIGADRANDWCRTYSLGIVCVPYPDESDVTVLQNDYFLDFSSEVIHSNMSYRLPGDIGRSYLTTRTAAEGKDQAGFLTDGPYLKLQAGEYHFQIEYQSSLPGDKLAGYVEVFSKETSLGDGTPGNLGMVELYGTSGAEANVSGTFTVPVDLQEDSLETRIFWSGKGEMTTGRLLIYTENGY